MKTFQSKTLLAILFVMLSLCVSDTLRSESPEGKGAMDALTQIRDANKDVIDKQGKTLDVLDDVEKQATQLRITGKRS